jgi:hypothetical protein
MIAASQAGRSCPSLGTRQPRLTGLPGICKQRLARCDQAARTAQPSSAAPAKHQVTRPNPLSPRCLGPRRCSHKDPTYKTTPCDMLMIEERLLRAWLAYKRLTGLSFPRRFPIVQFPNLPLIVAALAGEAGKFLDGIQTAAWEVASGERSAPRPGTGFHGRWSLPAAARPAEPGEEGGTRPEFSRRRLPRATARRSG